MNFVLRQSQSRRTTSILCSLPRHTASARHQFQREQTACGSLGRRRSAMDAGTRRPMTRPFATTLPIEKGSQISRRRGASEQLSRRSLWRNTGGVYTPTSRLRTSTRYGACRGVSGLGRIKPCCRSPRRSPPQGSLSHCRARRWLGSQPCEPDSAAQRMAKS